MWDILNILFIISNEICTGYLQWKPENSGIWKRLLKTSYNFKKCNEHKTQQLCSVNRPILLKLLFLKCLVKLFAL